MGSSSVCICGQICAPTINEHFFRDRCSHGILVAGVEGAGCARWHAQAYPTRPVTVIVPFAAGGGNDILARLLTQHMGKALGQQFVIENRAGAGGIIGAPPSPRRRPTAIR